MTRKRFFKLKEQGKITVHVYSCGCRVVEPNSDGPKEEKHNHPCPKHSGHE